MKKTILYIVLILFLASNVCLAESVWNGTKNRNVIALTFDDGPKPEYVYPILDALDQYGAKATFFLVGQESEKNPDLVTRMHDSGHEVANHTYSHIPANKMTSKRALNDIERCNIVLKNITGERPIYFRPAGGVMNQTVAVGMKKLGMRAVFWSVNGEDYVKVSSEFEIPEDNQMMADELAKKVLDKVKPGTIILLHSSSEQTVRALPVILKGLSKKGYGMVTIRDLVEEKI